MVDCRMPQTDREREGSRSCGRRWWRQLWGIHICSTKCRLVCHQVTVDVGVQVERERSVLLVQTFKQLNTQYSRRMNGTGCPLVVHRVKVTFRDEPGEGSGVARSFYTAFSQAVLSAEKLPNLEPALVGSKSLQYSTTFALIQSKTYSWTYS